MSEVAAGLGQVSEGTSLKGTVRISASQIVATYILPAILGEIHVEEPDIQIEVVATDETDNLLRRRSRYCAADVSADSAGCDCQKGDRT